MLRDRVLPVATALGVGVAGLVALFLAVIRFDGSPSMLLGVVGISATLGAALTMIGVYLE